VFGSASVFPNRDKTCREAIGLTTLTPEGSGRRVLWFNRPMTTRSPLAVALLAGVVACHGATYSPRIPHKARRVVPESIEILATDESREGYVEIGIISSSGSTYDAALVRGRNVAAEQGCDALAVIGVSVQSPTGTTSMGTPGGSQELRIACLVVDQASEEANPKKKPPVPAANVCRPECRSGYDCVYGECYPACNPPCAESEVCAGHGTAATCGAK
jgi:hypothetical protein